MVAEYRLRKSRRVVIRTRSLIRYGLGNLVSPDDMVRCIFDVGYTARFWTCQNQNKIAFSGLDLSNISSEYSTKPSTTQGRSRGVEIHKLDPAIERVHEEVPDEASETGASHD